MKTKRTLKELLIESIAINEDFLIQYPGSKVAIENIALYKKAIAKLGDKSDF